MAEPIESVARVGVVHFAAYPQCAGGEGPILESLARIAEDEFFGAVEVTGIRDPAVRREARALLDTSHMDVVFGCQPAILSQKLSLSSPDRAEQERALAACREMIDQAYELGARILMVMSGPDPGEGGREDARGAFVGALKQLCRYAQERAEEYILALSIETFDREIDKKCLVGPTREAAGIVEAVKAECSNIGLTLDLSHQPLIGEPIGEMLVEAGDTLIHAHFGNCVLRDRGHPLYGDQHPPFGISGGENDVEEMRLWLEALFYSGFFAKSVPTGMPVLSMEMRPSQGQSSEVVIANGKRTLREAWARLSRDRWAEGRL
jgi:sugar phosphate isomerase/epimerase